MDIIWVRRYVEYGLQKRFNVLVSPSLSTLIQVSVVILDVVVTSLFLRLFDQDTILKSMISCLIMYLSTLPFIDRSTLFPVGNSDPV